jgi:hypothetical protein
MTEENFTGTAVWQFERFTLTVIYSNIWNGILRVMLRAPK